MKQYFILKKDVYTYLLNKGENNLIILHYFNEFSFFPLDTC
jgi:hypothetical protein